MSEIDDWAPVGGEKDDWQAVNRPPPPTAGEALPEAFLDRLKAGQAIGRILTTAGHDAKEAMAGSTPTGFSDENLKHLVDLGIFHDPDKGRGGPIQMLNETVMMPAAQLWQAITAGTAGGIHGAGGAVGQLVEEMGGSQGTANRAKNEVINAANWAMIEGGFGRFSRPSVEGAAVVEKTIGGLPVEADFVNGAKVVESPHAEANLRRMWQEDGIHPAEAVHDAANDAFLKNEITAPREEIRLSPRVEIPDGAFEMPIERALKEGDEAQSPFILSDGRIVSTGGDHISVYSPAEQREAGAVRTQFGPTNDGKFSVYVDIRDGQTVTPEQVEIIKRMADKPNATFGFTVRTGDEITNPIAKGRTFDEFMDAVKEHASLTSKAALTEEELEVLTATGGKPGSLSAAMTEPGDIPLDVQPARPPGSLMGAMRGAADALFDAGRDAQMLTAPMARGTRDSMAMSKDFANSLRRNRWDWDRINTDIEKRFSPEQWKRMWSAMDEESLSLRLGEPAAAREHQGLATLTAEERATVLDLDARQQNAWLRAIDAGLVEGEGIPMHAPRMVVNIANATDKEGALALDVIGRNLRTRTPGMRHRKYVEVEETEAAAKAKFGEQAVVARDIRTVAMATSQLEDAIAGRQLIDNIKEYGKRTGTETLVEGAIPAGSDAKWFTLDHPSFKTWRPKFDKGEVVKDAEGNQIFEQVPIYVHGDFEGPLRAVLDHRSGAVYGGLMALKGKTMSLIMNSPMIHNAVEWGRAVFAMPGKVATFKVYFEGNAARQGYEFSGTPRYVMDWMKGERVMITKGSPIMAEAIDSGLVPVGHRFFNQDISGLMEAPSLAPGRSWTSQILAAVPGLFDEAAGTAVKRAIDKAGNFWHNTLLWDRVADLQMGLYTNFRADMMAKGIDQQTASRMAAHWANRYAGALPKEAMSDGATKMANMLLFSRSFTLGNMGVLKDMLTGLPKDVLAQIERDAMFKAGSIEAGIEAGQEAAAVAKGIARRKAIAVVAMDVAGMYVFNSLLQNATNVLFNDSSIDKEFHGYVTRMKTALTQIGEHPLKLVQPFGFMEHMSATSDNEPGRQERVKVGYAKDGTAIYARAPIGKIGEEFVGYMTGPLDMMRKKLGTIARPGWQIANNDAGFGRKIYDPTADTPAKYMQNAYLIAKHLALSQTPEGQFRAGMDLVKGEGDAKVNALQAFGPFAGVTFSKGAPGGPAVGEMYHSRAQHDFAVNQALPDIRRQIQRGDIDGAVGRMTELDIPQGLQRFYIRTTLNPAARLSPRATRDFYLHATPEQRERFDRALGGSQPQQ